MRLTDLKKRKKKTLQNSKKKNVNIVPRLPLALEGRYNRFLNSIVDFTFKEFKSKFKGLKTNINKQIDKTNIKQDKNEVEDIVAIFLLLNRIVAKNFSTRFIKAQLTNIFNSTNEFNRLEQARMINLQVSGGLTTAEIQNNLILGNTSRNITATKQMFIANNTKLIKSIPQQFLDNLQKDIFQATQTEQDLKDLPAKINKRYKVSLKKAKVIAKDQINKLNGNLAKQRQKDLGLEEYIWHTVGDSRVRTSHAVRNGKTFRWDGNHLHPSEDFGCRCIAIPKLKQK